MKARLRYRCQAICDFHGAIGKRCPARGTECGPYLLCWVHRQAHLNQRRRKPVRMVAR